MRELSRRTVIGASLVLLTANPAVAALTPTPRQSTGPFYPARLPLDHDNDLVSVQGRPAPARGIVTHLFGRVVGTDGRPIPDAVVEIWQCDALGRYHHPRDGGGADPNFQGFGRMRADADGAWRFRTIKPVPYPGRTPHIHVQVIPPGGRPFASQLYVAGEGRNAGDFLYRRLSKAERETVTLPFLAANDLEPGALRADAELVLKTA